MSMYATDGYTSYFAALLAWCSGFPVLEIASGVLLVIRLIADTPRAYRVIRNWLRKKPLNRQLELDL